MVLDARTLSSFYDLADVVRDYTTPSRGSQPLSQKNKNDACWLRFENGWHARHIAEALGLADAPHTDDWEEDILEALEGCTTRSDWNTQGIRLRGYLAPRRGQTFAADQTTAEGTNRFGEYRTTARANAIIQAALLPGIRREGILIQPEGKNRNSKQLAATADSILQREKNQGHYPGITYAKLWPAQVTQTIATLGVLFDWPGKGKALGIRELGRAERAKVDAEIIRRCVAQAKITPEKPPWGFFAKVEKEIHRSLECCGPDGTKTMAWMEYSSFTTGYANRICLQKTKEHPEGVFKPGRSEQEQIDDPKNQKLVKDAIGAGTRANVRQLMAATGLPLEVVRGILAKLGYVGQAESARLIRAIILPLHNQKLTPLQMWDQSPALQKLLPGKARGVARIRHLLEASDPPLTPWTPELIREERVLEEVTENLREVFRNHLLQQAQNEEWLARIRRNVSAQTRAAGIFERLDSEQPLTIDRAAMLIRETPAFTRKVIDILATETPQFVAIRGGELVIPHSGLQWIVRGGD